MRRRTGTEPATARSPLRLRMILAGFGLVACLVLAGWAWAQATGRAAGPLRGVAVLAIVGALSAIVDLVVLRHRWQHRKP